MTAALDHRPAAAPGPTDAPSADTGLLGLVLLASCHGLAADPDQFAHGFRENGQPLASGQILRGAKSFGLKARAVRTEFARLERTPLPALDRDLAPKWSMSFSFPLSAVH